MSDKKKRAVCIDHDGKTPLISESLMFKTVMEHSLDSLYFKDKNCRFILVNKNKAMRHGIKDPAEMTGKTDFDFISESNAKEIFEAEKTILETGRPIIGKIEKLVRLDGRTTWASASKYPLYDKNGNIIGIWGISRDITGYELANEALYASEAKHKAMIANISDVIAIIDQNGIITYTSPNIEKYFGWFPEDLVGTDGRAIIHPDDRVRIEREFCGLLKKDGFLETTECRYKCKDRNYKNIELTAVNLINDINIKGILINYHDISDRKKREEEILYLSYHDVVTGLYNRAFFDEECRRLDTKRQLPLSVIMGDVNGLKLTNDAFGHAEGDKLLIEIAKILRMCCRKEEIIARIGGDEFCILLPQTSGEFAQIICRRVYKACEEYKSETDKKTFYPSISLGHATKTLAHEPIESILKDAEDFMYKRKLLEHKSMHSSIITSIRATMLERSHETEEHAERMVELSKAVGQALNLQDEQLIELDLLSTLHDIGKMSIEERILLKPGKLTEEEWAEIRKHPEAGCRIAQASSELMRISYGILCHHERWDGKGYPKGLLGEDIPLLSRIIAVVDAYDAMTQDRPYRKAMSMEAAIAEIKENAGTQFDPNIARIFVEKVLGESWE